MTKVVKLIIALIFTNVVLAQTQPNDCVNALVVCGNSTFYSNASGSGNVQEVNACSGSEHNSLWLQVNIVQGGTLGFDLIPDDTDINVDYDFWVFGPNPVCGSLGSPIRCSTTNPAAAGLTNNHTGMYGSTTATTSGPGANGNGYVRWLTVSAGQTYYIAIDRPHGDGGFQLQWTGTAMNGTGAFPIPPVANSIPDLKTCSMTPNVGIFDLNSVRTSINPNLVANTITFHTTIADANDNINPLPNIYANTGNPQTIYARVTNNTAGCFSITSFNLVVNPLPNATISISETVVCGGENVVVTFAGTPNAEITYTINGGVDQIANLDASGSFILNDTPTSTTTYTLKGIRMLDSLGNIICSQLINQQQVVTVTPTVTPTFTQIAPICSGGTLSALPTTSNNGITGTWLPALNNTATTIYTFTPDSGQCADTTTMTITVNPIPSVSISGSSTVCMNASEPQVVLTGLNGTAPYTIVYSLNTVTQPQVITTGSSYTISVPTTSSGTFVYELISVTDSSSTNCGQAVSGTATVTINDAPVISTPTAYVVCDDSTNNDGFYCFDLTQKNSEISTDPNVVITYHETPTDAQTGANPITGLYCNIVPALQTIYVRTHFVGSPACYSTTTLQLQINPLPLANPTITDYELCDYDNPGDEEELFTLNSKTNEIANGQTGVTITYYATQTDAQNQTDALPNTYTNTSNPQQIWINISNNSTGCNTVSSFNLVVNPLPEAVEPLPIYECSNGAVTTATFNLTVNENVVTAGVPGNHVSYYTNLTDAQDNTNAITTPQSHFGNDNDIIYIRVENSQSGCYSTTTQLLRVTQGPTAVTPMPLERCDPNNDGFEVFNLDDATNEIAGGSLPSGVTVSYHETATDALLGANPLSSPYANIHPNQQTIYVKVFYTTTGCSNYVELQLIVNPTPEATTPSEYHLCDYTGATGYEPFNLITKIPEILNGIDPTTHTVTFYTSQTQAEQGTGNITNVTAYTNGTINQETLYIRVETNATGCYDIVTLELIVDPLPQSQQPNYPQYSLCDNDQSNIGFEIFDLSSKVSEILMGQTGMSVRFYPGLVDAENNTNAITNLNYQNQIVSVQTLGIRITNETTGCYVVSTMDIRVEPLPEPIPPTTPYTVCDDNQDGFSGFDLSTLETNLLGGENYILTFHETLVNAETNDHALPMNYTNIHPFTQIIYVRAEDAVTHCVSIIPITLEVNPSPIAPVNIPSITLCDTYSNDQDGITLVNLTVQTPIILGQQPLPASSYTVTYYTSEPAAQAGTSPIVNVTNYQGENGDIIYIRVENNAMGCYNIGSFELIIGIPLSVATPQSINECDTAPNDQYATFDLTVREILPATVTGYTVQYYPSLGEAQSNVNEITDITSYTNIIPAVQTLGIKITSPQGCVSYTTLNIRVLPVPTPNTNPQPLPSVCENATNPGQQIIDLTQNQGYIINGEPNVSLHYFPSLSDLENNTNEIVNPSAALVGDTTLTGDPIDYVQYVYIAVSSNLNIDHSGRNCYTVVAQGYVINPLPTVDIIGTSNVYQICESDPTGNDNIEEFDLTSQIPDLLEGNQTTPASTYSVAFYTDNTLSNASLITNPSAYTNTSNPQTIYVVVTNTTTGCTSEMGEFEILVNPKPIINIPLSDLDYAACDYDGVNDGQTLHDGNPLSYYINDILGATQSQSDYTVSFYYNSEQDAESGSNAIQDLSSYQVETGTYWVRVENNTTGCYIIGSFEVVVEELAEPNLIATTTVACVDFGSTNINNTVTIDSQVTGNYTFEWYADGQLIPDESGATLTITTIDKDNVEYSVIAISNSTLQCESDTAPSQTKITIVRSGTALNISYTVTNAFSDAQTITVTVDGYGDYQYSLDDGPILDNGGVFTNVSMGVHTVHVWDMRDPNYSCGVVSIEGVQVIDYPHYFTPNGDGINDTWNIKGLENFAESTKIYIFDRYAKLLKQISSDGEGWDGTFNGQPLPSTDYWFRVEYLEQGTPKEFNAHFSLKR